MIIFIISLEFRSLGINFPQTRKKIDKTISKKLYLLKGKGLLINKDREM